MKIVIGPYHPQLEDALAEEVRAQRQQDRLAPLLLTVPSDALRRRVKVLLAREHGLRLLHFHVCTFSRLTLTLFHEAHGPAPPPLRDETFMEEALRRAASDGPARGRFARMMENEGGCAALWQSLRDLKDGMVDPEVALEALQEGLFGNRDRDALGDLFRLYREVRRRFPEWRAHDRQDLDGMVLAHAPASPYLAQFRRVYYYGFYDLTQSQLELFRTVAGAHPVTLFYPLALGHPDWSFARDFYDRYLRGLAGADEVVDLLDPEPGRSAPPDGDDACTRSDQATRMPGRGAPPDGGDAAPGRRLRRPARRETLSCAGPRDEVLTAAKKILELAEEEGIDFRHVGVAARTLDPYLPWVEEIFPKHGIPFDTSAQTPLSRFGRARALLALLDLPGRDYPRAGVIHLVSSHDFDFRAVPDLAAGPRPDLWDAATRALGITRGMDEWRRLERYLDRGLTLPLADEEEGRRLRVAPAQLAALRNTVRALHADLSALPEQGPWSEFGDRWRAVMDRFFKPAKDGAGAAAVEEALDEVFSGLDALGTIAPVVSAAAFTGFLRQRLGRASVRPAQEHVQGVQVMDAGSARGILFRALFLLGMNEGVFPRAIREDPFLRDRARRVLERDLGCKVSSKLAGYDEEKLLFALLANAAADRLYCLYQRSDAAGRGLAPSWYLPASDGRAGVRRIPKSVLGKRDAPPFDDPRWLLPEELAVRRALCGEDPRPLVRLCGWSTEGYERSAAAVRALEEGAGPARSYDGVTGPHPEAWGELRERGLSPTALETYGRCPFQYFARRMLGLERLARPEDEAPLDAVEQGRLCHTILEAFYQGFDPAHPEDWSARLDRAAARALSEYEERSPTGYPAAWEAAGEQVTELLREVVRADLDELAQSGFRPAETETGLETRLGPEWPEDLRGLPVHGRLDRVDYREGDNRYRVIDYKHKSGSKPGPEDKDPVLSAIRGQKLQLPLYVLLAADYANERGTAPAASVEAALYFIARRWEDGPLSPREFAAGTWREPDGQRIRDTVAQLLRGIRAGEFFVMPGDHCRYCEVSEICRKGHFPSAMRAKRHPAAEALAQTRKQKGNRKKA